MTGEATVRDPVVTGNVHLVQAVLLALLIFFAPLVWGGNRPLPLLALQVMAIGLIASVAWRPEGWRDYSFRSWALPCVLLALPAFYLLPLPGALLEILPGRALYLDVLASIGLDTGWRAASIVPYETEAAWYAIFVPVATFVVALLLPWHLLRLVVLVMLFVAGAEALLGLVQYAGGPDSLLRFGNTFHTDAAVGTYANRNHLAGLLEMSLPVAIGFTVVAWARRGVEASADGLWVNSTTNKTWLYGGLIVLLLLGLIFTRSRTGVVIGLVFVVASAWMMLRRHHRRRPMGLTAWLSVGGIFAAMVVALVPMLERFTSAETFHNVRWVVYENALTAAGQFFPIGSGPGTFSSIFPRFQSAQLPFFVNHAHNDYIEWIIEAGAFAIVIMAWIFYVYSKRWWVLTRLGEWGERTFIQAGAGLALGGLALHGLLDFNLHIPANAAYFGLLAAVFLHNRPYVEDDTDTSTHRRRVHRRDKVRPERSSSSLVADDNTGGSNPFLE